ncbi:hypothetical protein BC831DRAFT_465872 [Entophlyctis helioformis]|nr:hypothetical protein BC831DRAFT_465872 [Entophlyctis helioformis]
MLSPLSLFGKTSSSDTLEAYPLRLATSASGSAASAAGAAKSALAGPAGSAAGAVGSSAKSAAASLGLFDDEETNWPAFAIQHYLEALLVSPLLVVETLTDVQFQKRIDTPYEDEAYAGYENVQPAGTGSQALPLELEGVSGLLKGHFTESIFRGSFAIIQPGIEEFMNDMLDVFEDVNPATRIISHAVAGAVLSPLELVRTRLIVQASSSARRRYYGPIHALYAIANEERPSPSTGSLSTLYSPRILIPSILIHSLGPFVRFFSARIIADELGLDPDFTPMMYRLATLGFLAIESAILAPLEMARKRLQVQRLDAFRSSPNPANPSGSRVQSFETTVETSGTPYTGIMHCLGSIIAEEGGNRSVLKKRNVNTNLSAADWQDVYGGGAPQSAPTGMWASMTRLSKGLSTLYRGFWAHYASTVVLYVSSEIAKDDGW